MSGRVGGPTGVSSNKITDSHSGFQHTIGHVFRSSPDIEEGVYGKGYYQAPGEDETRHGRCGERFRFNLVEDSI